jgi:hypothetical protein
MTNSAADDDRIIELIYLQKGALSSGQSGWMGSEQRIGAADRTEKQAPGATRRAVQICAKLSTAWKPNEAPTPSSTRVDVAAGGGKAEGIVDGNAGETTTQAHGALTPDPLGKDAPPLTLVHQVATGAAKGTAAR